jgi:hypothetical protein
MLQFLRFSSYAPDRMLHVLFFNSNGSVHMLQFLCFSYYALVPVLHVLRFSSYAPVRMLHVLFFRSYSSVRMLQFLSFSSYASVLILRFICFSSYGCLVMCDSFLYNLQIILSAILQAVFKKAFQFVVFLFYSITISGVIRDNLSVKCRTSSGCTLIPHYRTSRMTVHTYPSLCCR